MQPETQAKKKPKVLFVSMPWSAIWTGGLGVSTLKAILARDGIEADVLYLNIDLAKRCGVDIYTFISERSGGRGEIFFSPHYFGLDIETYAKTTLHQYYDDVFDLVKDRFGIDKRKGSKEEFLARCEELCQIHVPAMLDDTMAKIPWQNYDIVGFSLMFAQTLASLCLARRLKQTHPEKTILFGGPSCDDEMGVEIARGFPCVDVVSLGESDRTIVPLIKALREGVALDAIPGIAFRRNGAVIQTPPAPLLQDLDWLPIPDYDDYARSIDGLPDFTRSIYFETSRGCWWGQKSLCSFCGLNANGLAFRRKSPERALLEIFTQSERYRVHSLYASDNILDMNYFKFVLPTLAKWNADKEPEERLSLFYETKSNLKKDQMRLMKLAGINKVQPGIESFSDHVLELMRKGANGIQQIQLVKWATELGIETEYGILYYNPGEFPEDYEEMGEMVDFLCHLAPPLYLTPIALNRFSPYYMHPEQYGIRNIRADESYKKEFLDQDIDLLKLAYRFEYDHPDQENEKLHIAIEDCLARMREWKANYRPNSLIYQPAPEGVYILDRRRDKPKLSVLKGLQAEIFLFADSYHALGGFEREFPSLEPETLRAFLNQLVARKWMYRDRKDRYISLPIARSFQLKHFTGREKEVAYA